MHLLALSWDVDRPGWLDPRVHRLARALTDRGTSCEVVTLGTGPTSTRPVEGVDVTWVAEAPPVFPATEHYDTARVLATGTRASAAAERRCQVRHPEVVLAFGWQTAWTATTLRGSRGTPLVAMLDSTAPGRTDGRLDDAGRLAAQVEWWLTYEARRVVVPSDDVAGGLRRSYRLPASKVDVVAPGVDLPSQPTAAGAIVVRAPRRVITEVRRAVVPARVDTTRTALRRAGMAVVMNDDVHDLLAAMAAGAAVLVPDEGPLRGMVHARRSGIRVPRDPAAVAAAVAGLRDAPARRAQLGEQARQRVADRHGWDGVAARLLAVAEQAAAEEANLVASAAPARPLRPMLLRSPLLGLVGDGRPSPSIGRHGRRGQG